MFQVGVSAYMKVAVLAVVLILTACGSSSEPKAQSSFQPSATPTPIVMTPTPSPTPTSTTGSPLTWSAPVRVVHQPPFVANRLTSVSCPSTSLCVAVDEVGNVVTSTNSTGGAAVW